MTDRTCADCGIPEERGRDAKGRPTVNLNPLTLLCVTCTVKATVNRNSFHSRREDRLGEVVYSKALAARNDE